MLIYLQRNMYLQQFQLRRKLFNDSKNLYLHANSHFPIVHFQRHYSWLLWTRPARSGWLEESKRLMYKFLHNINYWAGTWCIMHHIINYCSFINCIMHLHYWLLIQCALVMGSKPAVFVPDAQKLLHGKWNKFYNRLLSNDSYCFQEMY